MAKSKITTCYLSSAMNVDTSYLEESLLKNDVRILDLRNMSPGVSVMDSLVSMIDEADLFIAVLPAKNDPRRISFDNVVFELGVAVGKNKQAVVFAPTGSVEMQFAFDNFLTVRASIDNREAIDFAISQLLAAPVKQDAIKTSVVKTSRSLGEAVDGFIVQYRSMSAGHSGVLLEHLIEQVITASGVEVISSAPQDRGFDFVIWSDELQSSVGNPLLIEISTRISSKSQFKSISERLNRSADQAASVWSLLIYGEGPKKSSDLPVVGGVLSVSVLTLLESLRDQSFVDVVRNMRNRRAHGVRDGRN